MDAILEPVNAVIRTALGSLHITPSFYGGLFPPDLKPERIQEMLDTGVFPTMEGLAPAFTYCIILGLTRYFLHVFIIQPIAEACMQVKEVPLKKIPEIDAEFKNPLTAVDTATIKKFCAKSGKKTLDVRNYLWTRKKNVVIQKKIVKFVEAAWRSLFYGTFCVLGYNALFVPTTAIWITNTMNHWIDWPMHPVSDAINLYYQIELGSYFHQLMWTEVNRSDALEMIAHHFITIALIIASYLTNYTRIGSTILLLHDIPDVIMEFAKVLNYTSKAKGNDWLRPIVDGLFAMFMIAFFITRLVIYPRHILYSVIKEGVDHFGCQHAGCYVFIGLLSSLQCLHIFWFYLIARMAYRLLVVGQVEKDVRSDDEGEELLSAAGPPQLSDDEDEPSSSSSTAATATGKAGKDESTARKRKN